MNDHVANDVDFSSSSLAIAELYLMIAVIFRRFNVQIANNSAVPGKDPEYTDQLVAMYVFVPISIRVFFFFLFFFILLLTELCVPASGSRNFS